MPLTKLTQANHYRADIDGLRALAVLVVLFYHAHFPFFSGGFVGVDVFFVISGYLITQHLLKEMSQTGRISLLKFYSRRIKRLFPAIFVVVFATLLVWAWLFVRMPEETKKLVQSVPWVLFGFANIFFMNRTEGYFDSASDEMPFLHFWSLGVEEQFYFVWPWIFILSGSKLLKFFRQNHSHEGFKIPTLAILILIVVSSFALTDWLLFTKKRQIAFYLMPARAWELGLGALLVFVLPAISAYFASKTDKFKSTCAELLGVLGIVLIMSSVFTFSEQSMFPGRLALLPTFGAVCLIISGGLSSKTYTFRFMTLKLIVLIGVLSYGIYLWHWPLLAFAKIYNMGSTPDLSVRIAIVGLSPVLAYISLRYIETPVRYGEFWKRMKSYKVILLGGVSGCLLIALSSGLRGMHYYYSKSQREIYKMISERSSFRDSCHAKMNTIGSTGCSVGSQNERYAIYVWGNSHAIALFPMLEEYVKEAEDTRAYVLSTSSWPGFTYSNPPESSELDRDAIKFHELAFQTIKKSVEEKRHTSVILASRVTFIGRENFMSSEDELFYLDKGKTLSGSLDLFGQFLEKTILDLNHIGVDRILIMLPYPEFGTNIAHCLNRYKNGCSISKSDFEHYRKNYLDIMIQAAKKFENVRVFDPSSVICGIEHCEQVVQMGGSRIPIVYDYNHPSVSISRQFTHSFASDLQWLMGQEDQTVRPN